MSSDCTGDFRYILLTEVEAALIRLASGDAASYSIGSRSFTYNNLNDLIKLRDKLKDELYGGIAINYANFRDC